MVNDSSGSYLTILRPYHYIGLELAQSIYAIVLKQKATRQTVYYNAVVAAYAKKDLKARDRFDFEGGFCARGKLIISKKSKDEKILHLGLKDGAIVKKNINKDQSIKLNDVRLNLPNDIVKAKNYQYSLVQMFIKIQYQTLK